MTHRLRVALVLLCTCLLSPALAAEPEVFVEPFTLYNAPDLENVAQGLQGMLASRIGGNGYLVRTRGEPPNRAGDWVLRTSITRIGQIYSLDASLEPAAGAAGGSRTYQTAEGMDRLVSALEQVADHLRADLVARVGMQPAQAAPPRPGAAPSPTATPPATPPSPMPVPTPTPAPRVQQPLDLAPSVSSLFQDPRISPDMEGQALGLMVADADGDGNQEIIVLFAGNIVAFRDLGGSLQQAWTAATPEGVTPAAISAGDFDDNGLPELFVAGTRRHSPTTQVLEWSGAALTPKGGRISGFLRAVPHPGEGLLLLGMDAGPTRAIFAPGIYRYRWTGSGYEQQDRYPVTEQAIGVNLDFLPIGADGEVITVVTTQGDDVLGLAADGRDLFKAKNVKGSMTRLYSQEEAPDRLEEQMVQISGHTVAHRTAEGQDLILLYKNSGGVGRLFKRLASFSEGQLLAYRWDGAGLINVAASAELNGYIADIGVTHSPGTRPSVVAAMIVDTGMFGDPVTRVLAYELP